MILTTGDEVSRATVSPHKFMGDPMAEYLYILSMYGCADETTGDVEAPTQHVCRFGKRLLITDSQGFVTCTRLASENDAEQAFNLIDEEYAVWSDEEIDDDERERQLLAIRDRQLLAWRDLNTRAARRYPKG